MIGSGLVISNPPEPFHVFNKTFLLTAGGVIAANLMLDRFVIRYGPSDDKGFIDADPSGFGIDDVLVGLGSAVVINLVKKLGAKL